MATTSGQQPSLLDPRSDPAPAAPSWAGIAQVLVDVPLAHLDRPFDYGIPADMADQALPGRRVKVRFAGRERDGYIVGRTATSDHAGALTPIRKVVGPAEVLPPGLLQLARTIAARYAGVTMDVLRSAIPPRQASVEQAVLAAGTGQSATERHGTGNRPAAPDEAESDTDLFAHSEHWDRYTGGAAFMRRLRAGESPRAVWSALPGAQGQPHWPAAIADAVAAVRAAGKSALVLVPDARDLALLMAALQRVEIEHVALTAEQGRAARYRRYLHVVTGVAQVVVGTRSAAFAPLRNLGLVAMWDDGDDLYTEPRAPYHHARQVLIAQAEQAGAAALFGSYGQSPECAQLIASGWARALIATRPVVREATARIRVPDEIELGRDGAAGSARFPRPAADLIRRALTIGPVLAQVPRAGYVPVIACQQCRTAARCRHCHGPLGLPRGTGAPDCRWCGRKDPAWACAECGHTQIRALRFGAGRTAEELGRAFPGIPVVTSSAERGVLDGVDGEPRLVVATPGAEPVAARGYHAAVLFDGAVMAARPQIDASVEALRRWLAAAALVRADGEVMLLGSPPPAPAQALLRWDAPGYAQRENHERAELRFPPMARMASITGQWGAVRGLLAAAQWPAGTEVLGPQPVASDDGSERGHAVVRIGVEHGSALTAALKAAAAVRSAHRDAAVRIQVDPDSPLA